jgi:hypothetical protein
VKQLNFDLQQDKINFEQFAASIQVLQASLFK